jgi:hypothetical protein
VFLRAQPAGSVCLIPFMVLQDGGAGQPMPGWEDLPGFGLGHSCLVEVRFCPLIDTMGEIIVQPGPAYLI